MTTARRRDRLTPIERDALTAAQVAYDGEHMDDLDALTPEGARRRRERDALDRAIVKINRARSDGRL